ncbi:hypothetical protein [Streptomyces sp. cmx-4-9]
MRTKRGADRADHARRARTAAALLAPALDLPGGAGRHAAHVGETRGGGAG